MKIGIKDLFGSIEAIHASNTRIGWPDDPVIVDIASPQRYSKSLDDALQAFQNLRGGGGYLICVNVNSIRRMVVARFVQGRCVHGDGQLEPVLSAAFYDLRAVAEMNGGELGYRGGNNYFDVSIPYQGFMRDDFPEIDDLPWEERYVQLLERESWESLRDRVFRFSNCAESIAIRCNEMRLSSVLIPSVGICVHPWLFAAHALSVVAVDGAHSALAALSNPAHWPRLYSLSAHDRWDIAQSGSYARQRHPEHFSMMPDLQDRGVCESLRQRISFALGDWADLPLGDESVDAVFATNALPRDSADECAKVLEEWARVIRPGGIVFIKQHHLLHSDIESALGATGWVETNLLGTERLVPSNVTRFQLYISSG